MGWVQNPWAFPPPSTSSTTTTGCAFFAHVDTIEGGDDAKNGEEWVNAHVRALGKLSFFFPSTYGVCSALQQQQSSYSPTNGYRR